MVLSCPAILSEKPLELQRKVDFLHQELNMEVPDLLMHPGYLGVSLMQVCARLGKSYADGVEACAVHTASTQLCSTATATVPLQFLYHTACALQRSCWVGVS
jgi:hypothetical protein